VDTVLVAATKPLDLELSKGLALGIRRVAAPGRLGAAHELAWLAPEEPLRDAELGMACVGGIARSLLQADAGTGGDRRLSAIRDGRRRAWRLASASADDQ